MLRKSALPMFTLTYEEQDSTLQNPFNIEDCFGEESKSWSQWRRAERMAMSGDARAYKD